VNARQYSRVSLAKQQFKRQGAHLWRLIGKQRHERTRWVIRGRQPHDCVRIRLFFRKGDKTWIPSDVKGIQLMNLFRRRLQSGCDFIRPLCLCATGQKYHAKPGRAPIAYHEPSVCHTVRSEPKFEDRKWEIWPGQVDSNHPPPDPEPDDDEESALNLISKIIDARSVAIDSDWGTHSAARKAIPVESSLPQQRGPDVAPNRIVDSENVYGHPPDRRPANQVRTIPFEMIVPQVLPRAKQLNDLSSHWISAGDVRTFASIATPTGKGKIL
jgi:hypothetical protein